MDFFGGGGSHFYAGYYHTSIIFQFLKIIWIVHINSNFHCPPEIQDLQGFISVDLAGHNPHSLHTTLRLEGRADGNHKLAHHYLLSCPLTLSFNVNPAFIEEKLSADHETCWLPVLETRYNTGFLLRSHREKSRCTTLCMGVVLKGLLPSALRILTSDFAKLTDAKIFIRLLSLQGFYYNKAL
jgi:hypothetical protein